MPFHQDYLYVTLGNEDVLVYEDSKTKEYYVFELDNKTRRYLKDFTKEEQQRNADIFQMYLPQQQVLDKYIFGSNPNVPLNMSECLQSKENAQTCLDLLSIPYPEVKQCPHSSCKSCDQCPTCKASVTAIGKPEMPTSYKTEMSSFQPILKHLVVDEQGQLLGGYNSKKELLVLEVPIPIQNIPLPPHMVLNDPTRKETITKIQEIKSTGIQPGTRSASGIWYLGEKVNPFILKELQETSYVQALCPPQYYFDVQTKTCYLVESVKEPLAQRFKLIVLRDKDLARITKTTCKPTNGFECFHSGQIVAAISTDLSQLKYFHFHRVPVDQIELIPDELLYKFKSRPDEQQFLQVLGTNGSMKFENQKTIAQAEILDSAEKVNDLLKSIQSETGQLIQPPPCTLNEIFSVNQCRRMTDVNQLFINELKQKGTIGNKIVTVDINRDASSGDYILERYWNDKGQLLIPNEIVKVSELKPTVSTMMTNANGRRWLDQLSKKAKQSKSGTMLDAKTKVVDANTAKRDLLTV